MTTNNLPPEDVVIALETNAQQAYSEAMANLARLNLVHLAIVAKRIDENARYVVLDDSDQTVGDYVVIGLDADGDELRDNGDDFQDVPMNLCDANDSTWTGFLNRDIENEYGVPHYLDIDKVIAEYPTWGDDKAVIGA